MSRARDLSKLSSTSNFTVDTNNNIGVNSTSPDAKFDVVGIVSATKYFGDGSELTGITAGATLSAGSGDQKVVLTSRTTGQVMTTAGIDAELTYNSTSNTLSATTFNGSLSGNATSATTATTATNLADGANITTGTIADARLGTVSSSKLSGALPALDGSALTNLDIPSGFSELDAALFN